MAASAERDLRLVAWNPADPPTRELLDDVEGELLTEMFSQVGQDSRDQIVQATLDELEQMGMVAVDEDGGYWVTAAGQAALNQRTAADGPGGPVWAVTLYKSADGLPWVIDQITEVDETEPGALDLVCPAGADRSI